MYKAKQRPTRRCMNGTEMDGENQLLDMIPGDFVINGLMIGAAYGAATPEPEFNVF